MVTFWLLTALLIVVAIGIILYPVLRQSKQPQAEVDQKQINVDIAREQLDELQKNRDAGEISEEEYKAIKYEIEGSLIDDLSAAEQSADNQQIDIAKTPFSNTLAAIIILVFVPISSLMLYMGIGTPEAVDMDMQAAMQQNVPNHLGNEQLPSVEQMIEGLLAKLKENPRDERGWSLLGRTFMAVKRYEEAYQVYGKLLELKGTEDAEVLVSMADALAMSKGGNISGEPENLVLRALKVDPDNITALWLAGLAADEQNKATEAIAYWKRILPLITDDPTSTQQVKQMIAQAEGKPAAPAPVVESAQAQAAAQTTEQATSQPTENSGASVKVKVLLDKALNEKVQPNDIVFVFAKATQGPPMPLAAVKKRVQDMPLDVVLNDAMAMMPNMKISNFQQVVVSARVSKSGSPTGQKGDLMSQEVKVDLSDNSPVILTITKEL